MSKYAYKAVPTRNRLLSSCAMAAIATLMVHAPARAQIQGTPSVVGGSANVSNPGAITNIAPRTIINWSGVPDIALRAGTTQSFDGASNYIVLNRLGVEPGPNPTQLNGFVNSTINGVRGGEVWFYSANGIMVGKDAIFNVGSLLLTANPLNMSDESFASGTDRQFFFSRGDSGAGIAIENGAQINALGSNAYVALIAPRVRQSGKVTVNGSAAYVAAEEVTMTISGSLFDIEVTRGSDRPTAGDDKTLVHDGETILRNDGDEVGYGGEIISTPGPRHAIMVAVPKNDAVTMLLTGSVSYQQAMGASAVDNKIILSGGHKVANGEIGGRVTVTSGATADIQIRNGTYDSMVVGHATGVAAAVATDDGVLDEGGNPTTDLLFGGSLDLTGDRGALLEGLTGSNIVAGTLLLTSNGDENAPDGSARLIARTGSNISVGTAFITADVLGRPAGDGGAGGIVVSNRVAEILSDGGAIAIDGPAFVSADAIGGEGDGSGGGATAGTASVQAVNEGSVSIDGAAFVSADAEGGFGFDAGGGATGGSASIQAQGGGAVTVDGAAFVSADATGGDSDGRGGDASGATASIETQTGGTVAVNGTAFVSAEGRGGDGNGGGDGTGGIAALRILGGSITASGGLDLDADGFGGDGGFFSCRFCELASLSTFSITAAAPGPLDGGNGQGGAMEFTVAANTSLPFVDGSANGFGGRGGFGASSSEGDGGDGGQGGAGEGGVARLSFTGGTTEISSLFVEASGFGGEGGSGGSSFGETGPGGAGGSGGRGGVGQGGLIELTASGPAALSLGSATLLASGEGGEGGSGRFGTIGGAGGDGGSGTGGAVDVLVDGGTIEMFGGEGGFDLEAEGDGGDGGGGGDGSIVGDTGGAGGAGGLATGGSVSLRVAAGSANLDDIDIDADANGGDGGFGGFGAGFFDEGTGESIDSTPARGGDGGDAVGGAGLMEVTGGALQVGNADDFVFASVDINADADGGDGAGPIGSTGGGGLGGSASIRAAGGTIDVSDQVFLDTAARGGEGRMQGGDAQGGSALIQAVGPSSSIVVGGTTTLLAIGGDEFAFDSCCSSAGTGGTSTGGSARIEATGGADIDFGDDVELLAFGRGGVGEQGGDGFGGIASILSSASDVDIGGDLFLGAQSYGGFTFESEGGYGNGGGGGLARLDIELAGRIGVGTSGAGDITLDVSGLGGETQDSGCSFFCGEFSSEGLFAARSDSRATFAAAAAGGFGGDGRGGTAIAVIDGELDADELRIDAQGIGGSGFDGRAGSSGFGGVARVEFRGGSNQLAELEIDARGEGGFGGRLFSAGAGGNGGDGFGGDAVVLAAGGTGTIDEFDIDVSGDGGDGDGGISAAFTADTGGRGGDGGLGDGGTILVEAGTGGILTIGSTELDATGNGGFGGRGGASGNGTSGGVGGNGGTGIGGTLELRASGGTLDAARELSFDDGYGNIFTSVGAPSLEAEGYGGAGGAGGSDESGYGGVGGTGGIGGDGQGGIVLLNAAAGTLMGGPAFLGASGFGGEGGSGGGGAPGFAGGSGGTGGGGTGGTAEQRTGGGNLVVFGEDTFNGESVSVQGPVLSAEGLGGAGGSGGSSESGYGGETGDGGIGGDGFGGIALASVAGGTLTAGPASFDASGFGAVGGSVGGMGTGGVAEIVVDDGAGAVAGSAAFGDTRMFASGVGATGIETSGAIAIRESAAAPAGSLTLDSLDVEVTGSNSPSHIGFLLTTGSGPIRIAGDFIVDVQQNAAFAGFDGGSVAVGGNLLVTAGVSITLDQTATGPGLTLLNANDVTLTAGEGFGGGIFGATGGIASAIDITLRAEGDVALGFAQAGDDFDALSTGGNVSAGTVRTTGLGADLPESGYGSGDGSNIVIDAAGAIRLDNGDAKDRIILTARGGRIDSAGLLTATRLDAAAATDIALTDVDVIDSLVLATPNGSISGRNFVSDNDIRLSARSGITLASGTAGRFVNLATSAGSIAAGTLVAGADIVASASGGTLSLASGTAARDILLSASGNIAVANGRAGDDFIATSTGGSVAAGAIVTTGLGEDLSESGYGPGDGRNIRLDAAGAIRLDSGNARDRIDLNARGGRIDSAGLLTAVQLDALAATDIALTDVAVINSLVLTTPAGSISGRSFRSDNSIGLNARDGITLAAASAGGRIDADSAGSVSIQASSAADDIDIVAGGGVVLGSANAGDLISIDAGSGVTATMLAAAGSIDIDAGSGVMLGSARSDDNITINAGSGIAAATLAAGGAIDLEAESGIAIGSAASGGVTRILAGSGVEATTLTAGGTIEIDAGSGIVLGTADAVGRIFIEAGSGVSAELIESDDTVEIEAGSGVDAGTVRSIGNSVLIDAGSDVTADALIAGRAADVNAGGAIDVGSAEAGAGLRLLADGDIAVAAADVVGDIVAEGRDVALGEAAAARTVFGGEGNIIVAANGAASIDDGDAAGFIDVSGTSFAGDTLAAGEFVRVQTFTESGGSGAIDVGAATAGTFVGLSGPGTITAGTATAETDILASGASIALTNGIAGRDIELDAAGDITVAAAQAGDDFDVASAGGNVQVGIARTTGLRDSEAESADGFDHGSNIFVFALESVTLDEGNAADALNITARNGSASSSGTLAATSNLSVTAGDGAALNIATAGAVMMITAEGANGGALEAASLAAASDLTVNANLGITAGSVTAGRFLVVDSGEDIELQSASAGMSNSLSADGKIDAEALEAGTTLLVRAGGAISLGIARAGGDVDVVSDSSLAASVIEAGLDLRAATGAEMNLGDAIAGQDIFLQSEGPVSSAGTLDAGFDLRIRTNGDIALATARAGDELDLRTAKSVFVVNGEATGIDATNVGGSIFVNAVEAIEFHNAEASNDITLVARTGSVTLANGTAGRDILLDAAGPIEAGEATVGDDFVATSTGGAIAAGTIATTGLGEDVTLIGEGETGPGDGSNIVLHAAGDVALENGDAIDHIELVSATGSAESGGLLRAGALAADVAGDIAFADVDVASSLDLAADSIAGRSFTSGGGIALTASDQVTLTTGTAGGSISAFAGGAASFGTIRAGADIAMSGGSVSLTDGIAGRDIDLQSPGAISVGFAEAGDDLVADAGTTFAATTVITTGTDEDGSGEDGEDAIVAAAGPDGSNIVVDAGGAITLATGDSHDAMRLTSAAGSIASSDGLAAGTTLTAQAETTIDIDEAEAGEAIDLAAGGAITASALRAGTDVLLASEGGAILVAGDLQAGGSVDASGTAVTLNAVGPLAVRTASASAGDVALASGGDLAIQTARASGNVAATSGATLALGGEVDGTQLSFTSRDIAVGEGARVGTAAGTTGIAFTANNGSVVIGGSGTGTGYRLDNAEFGRLAARDVSFRSLGTTGVQIGGLTVRGAAAGSPNVTGRLSVTSGGNVDVTGTLSIENADAGNSVGITAGSAFYADAAGAGIAIANGSGGLTGSVDINAASITVASQAAVADLASADSIAERDDRLGQNDGADDRAGFIRAGGIRLAASQRIHVQNSGLNGAAPDAANPLDDGADNRAGLTAGASGITLVTLGQAPVEIIINGRQENGSGGFITGASLIPAIDFQGAQGGEANIAAGSTVNGCLIFGAACGIEFLPTVVVQDLLEDLLDESDDSLTRPPLIAFSQLISIEGSPLLPVIDEPVTGTGNDEVWMGDTPGLDCEDDREDCAVDQPVTGSGNEELQRGTSDGTPPTTLERRPDVGVIDAPVTGTGNEDLQTDDDGEDEG